MQDGILKTVNLTQDQKIGNISLSDRNLHDTSNDEIIDFEISLILISVRDPRSNQGFTFL